MNTNCRRLEGKVALITGGASGIGKGIASWFVREGACVMLGDINAENLATAKQELGDNCEVIEMDVTVEAQVEAAVAATVAKFGRLDVAVNSAGIGGLCRIVDLDEAEWDRVLDVDLKGVFLSVKHEARQMIAQGEGGSIINIASLNSRQPAEGMVTYCTSKAGVEMFTKIAAMELGRHKIRVNAISPGLISTPLTDPLLNMPDIYESFLENAPLGYRCGTTDDVAALALFLASDESTWITGDNILVDGGAITKRYPYIINLIS